MPEFFTPGPTAAPGGIAGFIEALGKNPGALAALSQLGAAVSSYGQPYMDPTEPGRNFRQGLAGIPQAMQQAQMGSLQMQAAKQQLAAQERQATAVQGLRGLMGGAKGPMALPGAGAGPGGLSDPRMAAMMMEAYPEIAAQQYLGRMFAKPTERFSEPYKMGEHMYQRNEATGEIERKTPSAGVTVNTGPSWVPKGYMPNDPNDPAAGVAYIPGGPADPASKATEGEKKGALYFDQMSNATEEMGTILATTDFDPASLTEHLRGTFNVTATEEFQQYDAAAYTWAEAFLRLKTGAQAPEHEVREQRERLFPQPGDETKTVAFKRRLRLRLQHTMDRYSAAARRGRDGRLPEADRKRLSAEVDKIFDDAGRKKVEDDQRRRALMKKYGLE